MNNLPLFETQNLILREIRERDCHDMFEYAQLSYVGPNAGWEPHRTLSHTKEVIRMFNNKPRYGQLGVFAIILKSNLKMIGTVELHTYTPHFKAELGYTINPEYWGNGYATEASRKILEWGFTELGLKRIECSSFPDNLRSQRVCEKLGFKFECIRKKGYYSYDGIIYDLVCYSMTDDEFYKLWEKQ